MSQPWKSFPLEKPNNEEIVWVRIRYYYGAPFLAQWSEPLSKFIIWETQLFLDWHLVQRWKSQ
jgi:hypothetical protein